MYPDGTLSDTIDESKTADIQKYKEWIYYKLFDDEEAHLKGVLIFIYRLIKLYKYSETYNQGLINKTYKFIICRAYFFP